MSLVSGSSTKSPASGSTRERLARVSSRYIPKIIDELTPQGQLQRRQPAGRHAEYALIMPPSLPVIAMVAVVAACAARADDPWPPADAPFEAAAAGRAATLRRAHAVPLVAASRRPRPACRRRSCIALRTSWHRRHRAIRRAPRSTLTAMPAAIDSGSISTSPKAAPGCCRW